jgi:hypothetical protein
MSNQLKIKLPHRVNKNNIFNQQGVKMLRNYLARTLSPCCTLKYVLIIQ